MQEIQPKMESKKRMPEIDEFSEAIGGLKADMAVIKDGIKEIRAHQIQANGKLEKAHDRIDDMIPDLNSAVANGNDWADTKSKAKWLIGLGFLGSAGGGFSISKIFGNLFS